MMNRLYKFLCICGMMLTATVSHAATTADEGRIFLQHQGVIAHSFAPGEMAKAIEQAAEGDTLLLANGNYASKFTISKSISIIGADASYINCQNSSDCIEIKSPGKDSLKVNLENLNATSSNGLRIEFYNEMEDGTYYTLAHPVKLTLQKSRILEFRTSRADIAAVNIECRRCLVSYMTSLRTPAKASFYNSELINLGDCDNVRANHCYIKNLCGADNSLITNSIIGSISNTDFNGNPGNGTSVVTNSLYNATDQVYALQDCILIKESLLGTTIPFTCKFTREQLAASSYLGTDGTVVGIFGGSIPSNISDAATLLAPTNRPQITNASVNWDDTKTKVKVNAKVTAK